jgi:hypothetical protein
VSGARLVRRLAGWLRVPRRSRRVAGWVATLGVREAPCLSRLFVSSAVFARDVQTRARGGDTRQSVRRSLTVTFRARHSLTSPLWIRRVNVIVRTSASAAYARMRARRGRTIDEQTITRDSRRVAQTGGPEDVGERSGDPGRHPPWTRHRSPACGDPGPTRKSRAGQCPAS